MIDKLNNKGCFASCKQRNYLLIGLSLLLAMAVAACGGGGGGGASAPADNPGGEGGGTAPAPTTSPPARVDFDSFGSFLSADPEWTNTGQFGLSLAGDTSDDITKAALGQGGGNDEITITITSINSEANAEVTLTDEQGQPAPVTKTIKYEKTPNMEKNGKSYLSLSLTNSGGGTAAWGRGLFFPDSSFADKEGSKDNTKYHLLGLISKDKFDEGDPSDPHDDIDGLLMLAGKQLVWDEEAKKDKTITFGGEKHTISRGYLNGNFHPFRETDQISETDETTVYFTMQLQLQEYLRTDNDNKLGDGILRVSQWKFGNHESGTGDGQTNYLPRQLFVEFNDDNNLVIKDNYVAADDHSPIEDEQIGIGEDYFAFTHDGTTVNDRKSSTGEVAVSGRTDSTFKSSSVITARMYGKTLADAVLAGTYTVSFGTDGQDTAQSLWGVYILQQQ